MAVVEEFFEDKDFVFIQQKKEWSEVFLGLEFSNRYQLLDEKKTALGSVQEQGPGFINFLKRIILRSHRPLLIHVYDTDQRHVLTLERPFFWFFSDMRVLDGHGRVIGHVFRRFGVLTKKYDICDQYKKEFARVHSPVWKIWSFPVVDLMGKEVAKISKKWGGVLKEYFTDADLFGVELSAFTSSQKAVVFAAALSIDFDFFENNNSRS